ncbi:hypothetical protein ACLB1G_25450 [Oxalobacteraceae bacterium A2-2]
MPSMPAKQEPGFLLRLHKQDSAEGVSEETVQKLMDVTGLSRTEVAHLALRQMANRYLPCYEQDEGALTPEQIRAIRQASPATDTPEDSFTDRIF